MDFQFTENSSEVGIFKAPLNLVQRFDTYIATRLNVITYKNLYEGITMARKLARFELMQTIVHGQFVTGNSPFVRETTMAWRKLPSEMPELTLHRLHRPFFFSHA